MPAIVSGIASTSFKHQSDQALLERLNHAIFVVKVAAQDKLGPHHIERHEVSQQREVLMRLLGSLDEQVRSRGGGADPSLTTMAFHGVADRFIRINPADVADRLRELQRLRERLSGVQPLRDRDFRLLDSLQRLLEAEAGEGVRGLYRF